MNDTLQGNGTNTISLPLRTAMNSLNLILGLPVNSYVSWLILSGAGGTIASEFFYLNLTASVIISSLEAVFYFAAHFTGNFVMYMVKTFATVLIYCSVPLFQCCVCVERYIAVVHPVVFLRHKALWYRVACCCVVWLMVIVLGIGIIVDFPSSVLWNCYVFLGLCVVCISVVSFCCFSVLRALKQPGPGEGQRDGGGGGGGEGNNMKRRAFNIILISLIVMVLTTLSYIPYVLALTIMGTVPVATDIMYAICNMSLFVHPLLYIHKAGKLQCFKGAPKGP